MTKLQAVLSSLLLSLPFAAANAETALEQLQRGSTGNQSTGKTFDGSNQRQPSDAYPRGGNTNIQTPTGRPVEQSSGTAGGYSSGTSSGTAGGYSTGTSSGTASGNASRPVRRGSEATKK